MKADFFDNSNTNTLENKLARKFGSLFLKYKNANPNIMILVAITAPDQTPVSNGSGATDSNPGIVTVSDAKISAGKKTDTKLISTIEIENKKTIHGII